MRILPGEVVELFEQQTEDSAKPFLPVKLMRWQGARLYMMEQNSE